MISQIVSNNTQGTSDIKLRGDYAIRRLIFYSSSEVGLRYKGILIANTNTFHIDFLSYYGYPKLSDFSITLSSNSYVPVLADIVPEVPISSDYFLFIPN